MIERRENGLTTALSIAVEGEEDVADLLDKSIQTDIRICIERLSWDNQQPLRVPNGSTNQPIVIDEVVPDRVGAIMIRPEAGKFALLTELAIQAVDQRNVATPLETR